MKLLLGMNESFDEISMILKYCSSDILSQRMRCEMHVVDK